MREVLFDVDGVLVHPWRFRELLIREHQIHPEATRPFFQGPFARCVVGELDVLDVLPPFLAKWGWAGTAESFLDVWFREENAPSSAVLEVVAELRGRGVRCHVASTQERRRAHYLANEMGFAGLFDSLLFSCDLGAAKPDVEYFRRAATKLRRSPRSLLLVDDAEGNVAAARSQGWNAVHYRSEEDLAAVFEWLDGAD